MDNVQPFVSKSIKSKAIELLSVDSSKIRGSDEEDERYSLMTEFAGTILRLEAELNRLNDSELKYRSMIEHSHDIIICIDSDLRLTFANNAYASLYNGTTDDLLNKIISDIYPAETAYKRIEMLKRVFETGKAETVEFWEKLPADTRCFEARLNPVKNINGETEAVVVHASDITQRKKAEQALAKESDRLRMLFEHSPAGILFIDPQTTRFMEFNTKAHEQLGYTREEFSKMCISDVEVNETSEETRQHILDIMKAGRADFETRHRTKNGEIRHVYVTAQLLEIDGEQIYECIWRDITERKKFEETLRNSEQSYFGLFNSIPDAILIHDENGIILNVNAGAEKMFGYGRDEIIGATHELLSAPGKNDPPDIWQTGLRALTEGNSTHFEFWGRRKNGDVFPKEVHFCKGLYLGIDAVIATIRDISEYKRIINELNQSQEKLRELNVTKDKFFSIIAHDLKNPFQNLLGIADILSDEIDNLEKSQVSRYGRELAAIIKNQYRLLENLLSWSRLQQNEIPFIPEYLPLYNQVEFAVNIVKPQADSKNISLFNNISEKAVVFADPHMLVSILQNLLNNAVKFSFPGGKVYVELVNTETLAEISIRDEGVGLAEEDLNRLFSIGSQFSYKGTGNEKGTGLGLLLCKEFIEKHGGAIRMESAPGKGSKVVFTIPDQSKHLTANKR